MLSNLNTPKNKTQLINHLHKLPPSTKIEIIEVLSSKDKSKLNFLFDKTIKNGSFSVVFVKDQ